MGMYATKQSAEDSLMIDTKWLKEHGYFHDFKNGGITWRNGWGRESSIGFMVNTMDSCPYIRFVYSTGMRSQEKKDMDYQFSLVKVPCNLGGYRWAFKCSLFHDGVYCGRTVYTLYQGSSDYFGCRHCMGIVYESQRKSGSKLEFFGRILDYEKKADKLRATIHKSHYQGRTTRKIRRLIQMESHVPPAQEFEALMNCLLHK